MNKRRNTMVNKIGDGYNLVMRSGKSVIAIITFATRDDAERVGAIWETSKPASEGQKPNVIPHPTLFDNAIEVI